MKSSQKYTRKEKYSIKFSFTLNRHSDGDGVLRKEDRTVVSLTP